MAMNSESLENIQDEFIKVTSRTTAAVIIPLFGYADTRSEEYLDEDVLKTVMARIKPIHADKYLYYIFVGPIGKLPKSVKNYLVIQKASGNTLGVNVPDDATYPQYIKAGVDAALKETNASFVLNINPWVMIQEGGVDALIERCNRGDSARLVSGFNLRAVVDPEMFDSYRNQTPKEQWDLSFDFLGMPRFIAEMIEIDPAYRTHGFLQRDIWQGMFNKSFGVISSERIPVFPFDFNWKTYETREDFEADRKTFVNKWRFDPGIKRD